MKPSPRILLVVVAVLGVVALIGSWLHKSVTLIVGGQTRSLETLALTVGGALDSAGISLRPQDQVQPEQSSRLQDGGVVRVERARPVKIFVDGESRSLMTTERRPDRLLARLGIRISPADRVLYAGAPVALDSPLPRARAYSLQIRRAANLSVQEGTETRTFKSSAPTVGQALWEAGIRLYAGDQVTPSLETTLSGSMTITLLRSREITVVVDGDKIPVRTTAATVGEALAGAGLSLQRLDYSMPPESAPLPADGNIRVVRVHEEVSLSEKPLPFGSVFEPDPEILIDHRGVTDPGAYGLAAVRTRVRYEDGEEVSRQVEGEWVALEPRPRVMGYGTKIEVATLETPLGPLEYWRAVSMYATSYSPCRIFVDRCDSVTSSGARLQKGVAAVTLRHYRSMAGSQVYVPGYGIATILDVGGGIPGRAWIDLGYSDDDYVSWHQWVTVYFLTPVPPEGLILYVLN